ncbi:hypothetical protein Dimus_020532, partial [Dionaea muscipula]
EGQSASIITWPRAKSATRSTNQSPGRRGGLPAAPPLSSSTAVAPSPSPRALHRHRARSSRAGAQPLTTAGQAFISTTPPTTPQPRSEPPHEPSPPSIVSRRRALRHQAAPCTAITIDPGLHH